MYVFSPIGLLSVSLRCPVKDFTDIENAEILRKCMFFSKGGQQGVCANEPSENPEGGVASDKLFYAGGTPTPPGTPPLSPSKGGTPPTPSGRGTAGDGSKRGNKWRGDTKEDIKGGDTEGELPLPPQGGGQ